jgi:DDE superfamily endonuclease
VLSRGLIYDVSCGAPGAAADSAIWERTPLFAAANIADDDGYHDFIPPGHYIIGDMAYKLKPWVMRPYRCNEYTQFRRVQQEYFDKVIREARRIIERVHALCLVVFYGCILTGCLQVFGSMKKRFILLVSPVEDGVERRIQDVWCACILHNILLTEMYPLEEDPTYLDDDAYQAAVAHLQRAIAEDRAAVGGCSSEDDEEEEEGDNEPSDEDNHRGGAGYGDVDDRDRDRHRDAAAVRSGGRRGRGGGRGRGRGCGRARDNDDGADAETVFWEGLPAAQYTREILVNRTWARKPVLDE